MLGKHFYQSKRQQLANQMIENSLYLVFSGELKESSHDDTYPFEPYRNFLYLTGVEEPQSALLIYKTENQYQEYLFMHIPSEMEQRWMNKSFDPKAIQEATGIAKIQDILQLDNILNRLLFSGKIQTIYTDQEKWDMHYAYTSQQTKIRSLQKAYPYLNIINAFAMVAKMRTIKDDVEILAHRKAVEITKLGVLNMMKNMQPGMYEYEIEAYFDFILKSHGVKTPAFHTIAASGANANHMHYLDNNAKTKDGQMILFDLGARYQYYCADVSRTYPLNGKFTNRQAQLYEIVLKGLKVAEDAAKPGVKKDELQNLSKQVMAQELVKIGKLKSVDEIYQYYFHGSGHNIGLDTHDVGDENLILEKNLMFTLEPGLYFDDEEIGIRIEDTLVVTENGVDILSNDIPKEITDIEQVMKK